MQFLGQIVDKGAASRTVLSLFMCQNEPGLCDEWGPRGGGNAALVLDLAEPTIATVPKSGRTLRGLRYSTDVKLVEADDYFLAIAGLEADHSHNETVLGQLGGEPSWIQGDETPECDAHGKSMRFVAQLEEGPRDGNEMNFGGGGCAYVFRSDCCPAEARFLWQC